MNNFIKDKVSSVVFLFLIILLPSCSKADLSDISVGTLIAAVDDYSTEEEWEEALTKANYIKGEEGWYVESSTNAIIMVVVSEDSVGVVYQRVSDAADDMEYVKNQIKTAAGLGYDFSGKVLADIDDMKQVSQNIMDIFGGEVLMECGSCDVLCGDLDNIPNPNLYGVVAMVGDIDKKEKPIRFISDKFCSYTHAFFSFPGSENVNCEGIMVMKLK